MRRSFRALLLPAVAVLLPCAFIAALALRWLAVEREAASRRGDDAKRAAVAEVGRGLTAALNDAGPIVERLLRARTHRDPEFAAIAGLPPPVSRAYLFDSRGQPVGSGGVRATSVDSAPMLESETAVAAGARALAAGRWKEADQTAARLFACCVGTRDEYGVAFVSYAAWQRAIATEHMPDRSARAAQLAHEVRALIDVGHLGSATDVTQVRLLAQRLGPIATALTPAIDFAHARADRDADYARAAAAWVPSGVDIGPLRRGTQEVAAGWRASDGSRVVMVVEPQALSTWLAAGPRAVGFDVNLATEDAADSAAMPLFSDYPPLRLAVHGTSTDPTADGRRQQLFIAAAAGGLILTLLVGYLALRDVSRELRLASLRAAFIAGVTHELKTPLTSIRLLAETLRDGRARRESHAELLDTIVHEAESLSEVVDNVLSSSRIESGTRGYEPKPVCFQDAVRSVLRRFDYVIVKDGFRLEATIDDGPAVICVDAEAFAQAVINLLGNAVKYSGTSREIRVAAGLEGAHAIVRVTDFGIGIPEAEQHRIFDRFYRVSSIAGEVAGAGLGLALARHFAESHGGQVTVTSKPGQGSTFTLQLPATPSEAAATVAVPIHG